MGISNLVALFIIVTTAATLNVHGIHRHQESADAPQALRPLAGDFAFAVFAADHRHGPAGAAGSGRLGGYAWARPLNCRSVWRAMVSSARLLRDDRGGDGSGRGDDYLPIDPMNLFLSAVINGVAAVPIMAIMMLIPREKGHGVVHAAAGASPAGLDRNSGNGAGGICHVGKLAGLGSPHRGPAAADP